jgi:hypothetical protein
MTRPYPFVISLMHGTAVENVASQYAEDTEMHRTWLTLCFTQAWEVQRMKNSTAPMYAVVNDILIHKMTQSWCPHLLWKHCDTMSCDKLGIRPEDFDPECMIATIVILHNDEKKDFTQLTCRLPRCPKEMFDGIRTNCISLCAKRDMWPPQITCDSPFCVQSISLNTKPASGSGPTRKGNALYCCSKCAQVDEKCKFKKREEKRSATLHRLARELEDLKTRHTHIKQQLSMK